MPFVKLIEDIVKTLVDKPEEVKLESVNGERTHVVNIQVDKSDVGKVIGKEGSVIMSIRTLAEKVASKHGKRVNVHVLD